MDEMYTVEAVRSVERLTAQFHLMLSRLAEKTAKLANESQVTGDHVNIAYMKLMGGEDESPQMKG